LAITKKLVELLGGAITIQSEAEKGTAIHISLHYNLGTQLPEQNSSDFSLIKTILKTKRILIADDEEWNVKLLQAIFNNLGVDITTVSSGVKALSLLENENFDLVILDLRMPELDGIEATRRIRSISPESKSLIPVIILTASANNRHWEACKEAGVNAIITKPFDEMTLLEKIVQLTENKDFSASQAPADSFVKRPASTEDAPLFNLTHLRKLANDDKNFVQDMVKTFLTNLTSTLESVEQLMGEKNFSAISDAAHKICPPCRFIEANTLLTRFKNLELYADEKNAESIEPLFTEIKAESIKLILELQKELSA